MLGYKTLAEGVINMAQVGLKFSFTCVHIACACYDVNEEVKIFFGTGDCESSLFLFEDLILDRTRYNYDCKVSFPKKIFALY